MYYKKLEKIFKYLSEKDENLIPLFQKIKFPKERNLEDGFSVLVEIIISQQLSGKAADTIISRFREKHELQNFYGPENLKKVGIKSIRECGVSNSKASYILGLRDLLLSDPHFFKKLSKLEDEDLSRKLTKIKGIGSWTADIFMMSFYGRLDIFPIKDATIQNAIRKIYKIESDKEGKKFSKLEDNWKPFRTIVARLMWNAIDNKLI